MEHILQIDYLADPFVTIELKSKIFTPKKQNPWLKEMKKELRAARSKGSNRWSDEEERICDTVANNGDYVVHHRLDKITRGKTVEDYLREWGGVRRGHQNHSSRQTELHRGKRDD